MNTLKNDLRLPLDEVERAWIRKPATIIIYPPFIIISIIIGAICGIIDAVKLTWNDFAVKCWIGRIPGT